jgi:hypothetical protein
MRGWVEGVAGRDLCGLIRDTHMLACGAELLTVLAVNDQSCPSGSPVRAETGAVLRNRRGSCLVDVARVVGDDEDVVPDQKSVPETRVSMLDDRLDAGCAILVADDPFEDEVSAGS